MTEIKINRIVLEEALYEAELQDYENDPIIPTYSGRSMYGAECLALDVQPEDVVKLAMAVQELYDRERMAEDDYDGLKAMLTKFRVDSLGFDSVIYFPGFVLA